jgi:hypothetical protein
MIHFVGSPNCPARQGVVTDSEAQTGEEYRALLEDFPGTYCAECDPGPIRTDSDRYAELRELVEAWIATHTGLPFANEAWQALFDWRHR